MNRSEFLTITKTLLLTFFATLSLDARADSFGMTFSWGPTVACDDTKSPPLRVFNVPSSASYLRITLYNNATGKKHGSAMLAVTSKSSFAYGEFKRETYVGPCSPPANMYRLEVLALDGGGEVKAIATGTLRFPER